MTGGFQQAFLAFVPEDLISLDGVQNSGSLHCKLKWLALAQSKMGILSLIKK